jgi:hypothetical protein
LSATSREGEYLPFSIATIVYLDADVEVEYRWKPLNKIGDWNYYV